jgi:hypothetical protein
MCVYTYIRNSNLVLVFYVCETVSLSLMEEHKLQMSEKQSIHEHICRPWKDKVNERSRMSSDEMCGL